MFYSILYRKFQTLKTGGWTETTDYNISESNQSKAGKTHEISAR